ncbi:MAG: DNA gyrase inhibitor YacG [Chromatiaceae bacterium]|nr:DNA gyrase inhibitor YacG [Gammaproteobacteria bacterium]MCP5313076.1 DNA gyrase inhibitor YacG [Chromatiaceae bacterium]
MEDRVLEVACPTCGKSVRWTAGSRWRPFCSERCKLIDLGEWLAEERAIPGDPAAPDWNEDG